MILTTAQKDQFEAEGYVVVGKGLTDADLNPVISEYEGFIDRRARELHAEGKIQDLHASEPFERRLIHLHRQCEEIYPDLDIMHLRGRAVFEFMRSDSLLDLVEPLIGTPEITCNPIQHLRPKLPARDSQGGEHVAQWHQDMAVMLPEADPVFILTVWIALAEATPENGCMQIIPGVQGKGLLHRSSVTLSPEEMPEEEPVTLPMGRGDVLLMHKEIPHRSFPNTSDTVRWSIDLRFQATGTPTGRSHWPDFPVRSAADPSAILTDYEAWSEMWIAALAGENTPSYRWR